MATPAGWYPDVQVPGGERYWDGQQWTNARRDGQGRVPPPPLPAMPPPRTKLKDRPLGVRVAVAVVVLIALVLVLSAVFYNSNSSSSTDDGGDDSSDASSVTCDSLAQEAVRISKDKDVQLLKVRGPVVKVDNRETYSEPTGDGEALILSCTGEGVWSSSGNGPVLLRYTIDSDGDTFVSYTPQ